MDYRTLPNKARDLLRSLCCAIEAYDANEMTTELVKSSAEKGKSARFGKGQQSSCASLGNSASSERLMAGETLEAKMFRPDTCHAARRSYIGVSR
jgi:hypothetical protein